MTDRELSALRAARIGFVFQQFFLAEHQTVLGNVADGLLYAGVRRGRAAAAGRCRAGPGRAGAPGRRPADPAVGRGTAAGRDRPGGGGRAAGACWPTSRPGTSTRPPAPSILALLEELNRQGTTIVIITHDHAVAARMRRRIEMLDGHIIADTSPRTGRRREQLSRQPVQRRTVMTTASPRPAAAARGPAAARRPGRAGQRRAADPQAARRAVGAGHRDRRRRDRRRPGPGRLLPGRAAGRDRQRWAPTC